MKVDFKSILNKFKAPSLSFLRPKDSIGIDIGSTSIKFVQIQNRKVIRWAYKELDPQKASADNASAEKIEDLISLLKDFYVTDKKAPKIGSISVNGNSVIVRYVKLPKLTPAELAQTIQFEAEPYIPFSISEVSIGFHILEDIVEDGQPKMETVLVAAKKELIEQKLSILNAVGVRPIVVDVDSFTLEGAYNLVHPLGGEVETALVINMGAAVTSIIIMENGVSRVVRDVFIAGNSINKSLQRIFDCSYEEAEKLKRKGQILVTPDEKEATLAQDDQDSLQISNTIVTVMKDLVAEVQRSIDFYLSQNPERQINRILLCGGSSLIGGLDRYLSQEFRLNVELFDPFAGLAADSLPDNSLRPSFVVAVGLAARKEKDS